MSLSFTSNREYLDYVEAFKIENDKYFNNVDEFKYAIDNSRYLVLAYDNDKLVGFSRAISEGIETAYIIGSYAIDDDFDIKFKLIEELEKLLEGKRKMLFSDPKDISLYEKLGYLRCKNAYTYINFDLNDYKGYFLPVGYKFETEFYRPKKEKNNIILNKEIEYRNNIKNVSFNDINELLTKAFFNRPHDINKTKEAFARSDYFEAAFDNDKIVGVARAITDGRFSTILNVAVDPEYQGLNIGKNIVLNLSKQLGNNIIFLNTHAGSAGFYNKIAEYRRNKTAFEKGFGKGKTPEINEMFLPKGFRFIDEY